VSLEHAPSQSRRRVQGYCGVTAPIDFDSFPAQVIAPHIFFPKHAKHISSFFRESDLGFCGLGRFPCLSVRFVVGHAYVHQICIAGYHVMFHITRRLSVLIQYW
jgi:hypothetical protein